MEMLISTLGCGRIELMLKQSAVYFVVVNFKDLFVGTVGTVGTTKIVRLFNKYPIKGVKALDLAEFQKQKVVNLMHNKEHLRPACEAGLRAKPNKVCLKFNVSS
jgi:hypothetical protein